MGDASVVPATLDRLMREEGKAPSELSLMHLYPIDGAVARTRRIGPTGTTASTPSGGLLLGTWRTSSAMQRDCRPADPFSRGDPTPAMPNSQLACPDLRAPPLRTPINSLKPAVAGRKTLPSTLACGR